jgi:MFS family permease
MADHQLHIGPQGIPHAPDIHSFEGEPHHPHKKSLEGKGRLSPIQILFLGQRKRLLTLDDTGRYSHVEVATGNLDLLVGKDGGDPSITITTIETNLSEADMRAERQERVYLHGRKLVFAFLGWLLTEFMGGLGGNMLGPALPIVASQFNGLDQLGWVGGAYYMTQCACMLLFGQCLALFNSKYVLISAVAFFMLGSCISGAAQNIETLIIGRAFAGIGAAGCWVSVQTLVAMLVELQDRPKLLGLFGLQNAVSGTVGPILAGALTNAGHWRWCFLIVLPLGAATILVNYLTLPSLPPWPLDEETSSKLDKQLHLISRGKWQPKQVAIRRMILVDWPGYFIVTSSLICFILALQWGGSTYAWKSTTIIGLFVSFALIMGAFVCWETQAAWPIMPPKAFRNRTLIGASILAMFTLMCNLFFAIFGPVLYEAGRGSSSLKAGILIIPFLLTVVLSQGGEGFVMSYTKRYWHWGPTSPIFLAIGGGLLFTVNINTSSARLIGYQIIYGLGIGFTQNVAFLSVQADNEPKDVPAAIAIVSFAQLFGGMCGPVIGQAILSSSLRRYLPKNGVPPAIAIKVIQSVGAVWELQGDMRTNVVKAYLRSLNNVYIAAVPIAFCIILAAFLIRNVSLKSKGMI